MDIDQNPCLHSDLVISEILIKLPVKSLVRFKSVCKEWYSIISSPRFAKLQLDLSKTDPSNSGLVRSLFIRSSGSCDMFRCLTVDGEEEEVWDSIKFNRCNGIPSHGGASNPSSVNGLVCFYLKESNCFCIWNPCVNEFCQVPFPKSVCLNMGFGYVSGMDDYKIFAIGMSSEVPRERLALVYSLRANKWRKIDGFADELAGLSMDGVLVNETLYWASRKIIGFILRDDTSHEVPRTQLGNNFLCMGLCTLDGSLCAWDYDREGLAEADALELCMFKYQSSTRCWTKLFKLDISSLGLYVRGFFGFTTSGKVLVQRNHDLNVELFLGCPNQNPPNFVSLVQGSGHVVSFYESLVSPSRLQNGE